MKLWDVLAACGLKKSSHGKRIIMLGLDASGRTTTLYMLKAGEVVTTIPTIGFNVETLDFKHPKLGPVSLTVWDVGGCDKIRPLWRHYFEGLGGLMFFVDSNDRERLSEAKAELETLLREPAMRGVPLLLVANKQDLPNSMSAEEVEREFLTVIGGGGDREVMCAPTVATTGQGLWEAMLWITTAADTFAHASASDAPPAAGTAQGPSGTDASQEETVLQQWLRVEDGPDDEFLKALEDYTLDTWDHRTHLRIAWLYLTHHGRREGMRRIFTHIKAFIENSPRTKRASGKGTTFHATLTYVWAHLVHYAIASMKPSTGDPSVSEFKRFLVMNPQLSNGGLPLHYYTKQLMFDTAATRSEIALPDKRPLPSLITNVMPLKIQAGQHDVTQGLPRAAAQSDVDFLRSVRDRTLQGWGHEAMLRVIWACMRLHGVKQGRPIAEQLLCTFQGAGYHVTITTFWTQTLASLMVHDWAPAVKALDAAAASRAAAQRQADQQLHKASELGPQDAQWATDLVKALNSTVAGGTQTATSDNSSAIVQDPVMQTDDSVHGSIAVTQETHPYGTSDTAQSNGSHTTTDSGVKASAPWVDPLLAVLLDSADPAATEQIPTLSNLKSGQGYGSVRLHKMLLDQHMYLASYSPALIYSDAAAAAFVMPDKKTLPSVV